MFGMRQALFTLGVSVAVLASVASSATAAPVVFDSFTSPASGVQTATSTGSLASNNQVGLTGILLGTQRLVDIQRLAGLSTSTISVNTGAPGGVDLANGINTGSTARVIYNFQIQGFAADFQGVGTVTIKDAYRDVGSPTIALDFFNGASSGSVSLPILANTTGTDLVFSLAGISNSILQNVTKFQLTIDTNTGGAAGTDLAFGPIVVGNAPVVILEIPEPATMATFGLMALVGGYVGRGKLKARTVAQA